MPGRGNGPRRCKSEAFSWSRRAGCRGTERGIRWKQEWRPGNGARRREQDRSGENAMGIFDGSMAQAALKILQVVGAAVFMVFFFGMCVLVHELGHFLAAKLCGLHITAFSLGFKKIWGKKIGGVEYRIGMLPFGGYVELPQLDSGDAVPKDENGQELP